MIPPPVKKTPTDSRFLFLLSAASGLGKVSFPRWPVTRALYPSLSIGLDAQISAVIYDVDLFQAPVHGREQHRRLFKMIHMNALHG